MPEKERENVILMTNEQIFCHFLVTNEEKLGGSGGTRWANIWLSFSNQAKSCVF